MYDFVKPNNQISKLFERNSEGDYNLPIIDRAGNDLRMHGSGFMINT